VTVRGEQRGLSVPEPSRLAEMGLCDAVAVPARTPVAEISPGDGQWIVIREAGHPVAAVPAAVLRRVPPDRPVLDAVRDAPATVIAHAGESVAHALASWAFSQLAADGAAVIVDEAGGCRVWAGEDLAEVRDLAGRRTAIDTRLPGDEVRIPRLSRPCRFNGPGDPCAAVLSFAEFPEPMPECPNPGRLSPHRFVW